MTTAELRNSRTRLRGLHALEAQRHIDWLTLRLAPSLTAGLIALSHWHSIGHAAIVFACMLIATQAIERTGLPLHLMPTSRFMLGLIAPVMGVGAAWLIALAVGDANPLRQ